MYENQYYKNTELVNLKEWEGSNGRVCMLYKDWTCEWWWMFVTIKDMFAVYAAFFPSSWNSSESVTWGCKKYYFYEIIFFELKVTRNNWLKKVTFVKCRTFSSMKWIEFLIP